MANWPHMATGMQSTLSVVFTNAEGEEVERYDAPSGEHALKLALLMLAKRDALAAGDTLRVYRLVVEQP
jgi:hypothetical protein